MITASLAGPSIMMKPTIDQPLTVMKPLVFYFLAVIGLEMNSHGGCQVNGPKVAKFLDR